MTFGPRQEFISLTEEKDFNPPFMHIMETSRSNHLALSLMAIWDLNFKWKSWVRDTLGRCERLKENKKIGEIAS